MIEEVDLLLQGPQLFICSDSSGSTYSQTTNDTAEKSFYLGLHPPTGSLCLKTIRKQLRTLPEERWGITSLGVFVWRGPNIWAFSTTKCGDLLRTSRISKLELEAFSLAYAKKISVQQATKRLSRPN